MKIQLLRAWLLTQLVVTGQQLLKPNPRIISGKPVASASTYPFMVSITSVLSDDDFASGPQHTCGGSLVAPNVVLSAAHCSSFVDSVQIGRFNLLDESNGYITLPIKNKIVHPKYDGEVNHDIVLFELDGSVDTNTIPVVNLDSVNQEPQILDTFTELTVLGWGMTENGVLSNELLQVEVDYVPNKECSEPYNLLGLHIESNMLCAARLDRDACQGDSGGPLLYKDDVSGNVVQVGIVSWGEDCAKPGYPGVYSRISFFSDWISSTLCAMSSAVHCTPTISPAPSASPSTSMSPSVTSYCKNVPNFVDIYGDDCTWYASPPKRCIIYGDTESDDGLFTAQTACCVCGGGKINAPTRSPQPSQTPTVSSNPSSSFSPVSQCVDFPDYIDDWGDGCKWYEESEVYDDDYDIYNKYSKCEEFGAVENASGVSPNEACCICKNGNVASTVSPMPSVSAPPSLKPSATANPSYTCTNFEDFVDYNGHDCEWYGDLSVTDDYIDGILSSGFDKCHWFGDSLNDNGFSAIHACCICGGGNALDSPSAVPSITFSPSTACRDVLDWVDIYGDGCDWYAGSDSVFYFYDDDGNERCHLFGDGYSNEGFTANQACCICGGGVPSEPTKSPSPTAVPTITSNPSSSPRPTGICTNYPNWKFLIYDCLWFSEPVGDDDFFYNGENDTRCSLYGHYQYENGITAMEACCVCGGGFFGEYPSMSPSSTLSPTSKECQDLNDWFDKDGDSCSWYEGDSSNLFSYNNPLSHYYGDDNIYYADDDLYNNSGGENTLCSLFGNIENVDGISASQACCVCGGGDNPSNIHHSSSPSSSVNPEYPPVKSYKNMTMIMTNALLMSPEEREAWGQVTSDYIRGYYNNDEVATDATSGGKRSAVEIHHIRTTIISQYNSFNNVGVLSLSIGYDQDISYTTNSSGIDDIIPIEPFQSVDAQNKYFNVLRENGFVSFLDSDSIIVYTNNSTVVNDPDSSAIGMSFNTSTGIVATTMGFLFTMILRI